MAVEFNCDFAFALVAGVAHHSQPRARASTLNEERSAVECHRHVARHDQKPLSDIISCITLSFT